MSSYSFVPKLRYGIFFVHTINPNELEMRPEAFSPSFGYIRAVPYRFFTLTAQPINFYSWERQADPSRGAGREPVDLAILALAPLAFPRP